MKKLMLLLVTVLMVVCVGGCSTSNDNKNAVMKVGSNTAATTESYEYVCEKMFVDLVTEYTNGTITGEYYPAGQLGSSTELVEAVGLGTVQGTTGICYDIYSNVDPICIISCMPYLFKSYEHFKAFLETDNATINKIKDTMANESDILVLGYVYRPARVVITKNKEIYGPDDLNGVIYRSPEAAVNVKWCEAMGAIPVTITWSEVYTSLAQGAAQGADNSITTIVDSNLQDIIDCCSETNHQMLASCISVNKTWFESLTKEQQDAIKKAADEVTAKSWVDFLDAVDRAWAKLESAGVKCVRKEEIDVDEFVKRGEDIYKYFVENNFFTEEDYNVILNLEY